MTYSRDTAAISEFTGQPVNTWSTEWQHECEARAILKTSKEQRDVFFNGQRDEGGKIVERGLIALRGPQAAEELKARANRLLEIRATKN